MKMTLVAALIWVVTSSVSAHAQTGPSTDVLETASTPDAGAPFNPAGYGMVEFSTASDLFQLLEVYCRDAVPGHPCAYIWYDRQGPDVKDSFASMLKPVLNVQKQFSMVWTIRNKQISKVSVDKVFFEESTVKRLGTSTVATGYVSMFVIGVKENEANCKTDERHCLPRSLFDTLPRLSESAKDRIWPSHDRMRYQGSTSYVNGN